MHNQLACLVKMAINDSPKLSDYAIDHLRRIILEGKRIIYEVKEVRTEPFIFEGIGSVLAIYQF